MTNTEHRIFGWVPRGVDRTWRYAAVRLHGGNSPGFIPLYEHPAPGADAPQGSGASLVGIFWRVKINAAYARWTEEIGRWTAVTVAYADTWPCKPTEGQMRVLRERWPTAKIVRVTVRREP